jgi:threonine dehydrogenase-like Zn-dependent dehydrogenase
MMQALTVDPSGMRYRADYLRPLPLPGQALIRLLVGGICTTDLEVVKGYAGFQGVLGHEFAGLVVECEDEQWIGRRVVGGINLGCGRCAVCLSEGPEHCPDRTVLGIIGHEGAFADYLTLPVANLLAVPDELPDEAAVFVEPLAAALRIREQIVVRPSDQVAVVGPGRLGTLIAQVLALSGTQVIVLGRRRESLELIEQLGLAADLVDGPVDRSFDLVVEATGNEAGLAHSLRLLRPQGTLVLKSTFAGRATVDLSRIVVDEIRIVGSRCGPFAPALRLLGSGAIRVQEMIEGQYRLQDGADAFEHASRPGVRKILLRP